MTKSYLLSLILFIGFSIPVFAQNTVGLLSFNPSKAFDGYNILYPHNQPNVYLLDNCGEIVHLWEGDVDTRPGNTAYITTEGKLIKTNRPAAIAGNPIWAGGGGATVEIRDWDNNLEWSYTLNDSLKRMHHDIAPMPNGNILMIVWELKNEDEAIQAGRDTSILIDAKLWPDYVVEVDPTTSETVWEWHAWDHLVQDYDDSKDNFGVVEDHPELIDLNYHYRDGRADWMHTNAIDFDAINDHVIISVPTFGEVWVIDHSTTTAQAAGHTGGFSGKGGDLIYRWGNPAAYRAGTEEDQKLFYQHDIHWIDDFLTPSHPHYGKLAVFNNRVGDDFSSVHVFNPAYDMYGASFPMIGDVFGPADFDLTIYHPDTTKLFSTGLSSLQLLPNGNTLICSGRFGYSFELTPEQEIVWEYKTPLKGGAQVPQGDTLTVNNNLTFRMKRYPSDFVAFDGKDLSQKGWIELNPDTTFCDELTPIAELMTDYQLRLFPNPASDQLTVEWEAGVYADICIFDLWGREVVRFDASGGRKYLDISSWEQGIYLVQIDGADWQKLVISR